MSKLHLKYHSSSLKYKTYPIKKVFELDTIDYEIVYDRIDEPDEDYGSVMSQWRYREIQEYKITFLTIYGLFLLCQ